MPGSIMDSLKAKEDEMEALLNEARKRAAAIREEAVRRGAEIKGAGAGEIEGDVAAIRAEAAREIEAETRRIEAEAGKAREKIRAEARKRREEAVGRVLRLISEGIDDREDDKGPGNRA